MLCNRGSDRKEEEGRCTTEEEAVTEEEAMTEGRNAKGKYAME